MWGEGRGQEANLLLESKEAKSYRIYISDMNGDVKINGNKIRSGVSGIEKKVLVCSENGRR